MGDRYLVDASLDQGNRPEKKLLLPSIMVHEVTREFRRGRVKLSIVCDDGMAVLYEPRTRDYVWRTSKDWRDKSLHEAAITKILSRLGYSFRDLYHEGPFVIQP